MSDLNTYIDTAQKFTAPPSLDTVPPTNHQSQVNYGLEIARRSAQRAQAAQPPSAPPAPPVSYSPGGFAPH